MTHRAKVVLAMLTLYVVWGTTYLAIKVGIDAKLPPALFASMRLIPASFIMFALAKVRGTSLALERRELHVVSVVGILLLVGGQYGMMVAERYVASGIAALVVALVPLWIALAESLFADMHRPGRLGWLGLAIGFSGLGVLLAPRLADMGSGTTELIGIAVVIVGTWLWTSGSVYSKRNPVGADGIVVTAYEMLVAGLVTLVLGTVTGEWRSLVMTPKAAGALVYLTVFGSCVAFTAFVYALKHLPASKVTTYAYVNPVIAVFAGWAAGRLGLVPLEPVTPSTLLGMAVIVAGVALTTAAPTLPPRIGGRADASCREPTEARPTP